ncbi:MAG: isocitrate lyase/phosphoenolpyruvate mutase family protein [Acidobacteriota bacterium]
MPDLGAAFRQMHAAAGPPFILANAWDAGSARMLESLGARAVATSSAAHAFTLGRVDGAVTRDEALAHAQQIVAAVRVPVQGDFENGWGESPEECATAVRLSAEIGLAGICLEDIALPSSEAYGFELAVERMRAAAAAARALPRDFVLTARADGVLRGCYSLDEALRRLKAFEEVGADCLYAPFLDSMDDLRRVCAETRAPVNALVAGHAEHSLADFAACGAARLSLGVALSRLTQRVIHDAAREMFEAGSFTSLGGGLPTATVDYLVRRPAPG